VYLDLDAYYNMLGNDPDEEDHEDWPADDTFDRALAKLQETSWYIYSSLVSSAAIEKVTSQFSQLQDPSPWNLFVNTLNCSMVSLQSKPDSDPSATSVPLDLDDEFGLWLADAINATEVSMIKGADGPSAGIGGFAFYVGLTPLVPDGNPPVPSPTSLFFTTDDGVLKDVFLPAVPPSMGLRDGATALILGVDPSKTASKDGDISLLDLARFVGLEGMFNSPFLAAIQSSISPCPATRSQRMGSGTRCGSSPSRHTKQPPVSSST
jgi:hypothetical protein